MKAHRHFSELLSSGGRDAVDAAADEIDLDVLVAREYAAAKQRRGRSASAVSSVLVPLTSASRRVRAVVHPADH